MALIVNNQTIPNTAKARVNKNLASRIIYNNDIVWQRETWTTSAIDNQIQTLTIALANKWDVVAWGIPPADLGIPLFTSIYNKMGIAGEVTLPNLSYSNIDNLAYAYTSNYNNGTILATPDWLYIGFEAGKSYRISIGCINEMGVSFYWGCRVYSWTGDCNAVTYREIGNTINPSVAGSAYAKPHDVIFNPNFYYAGNTAKTYQHFTFDITIPTTGNRALTFQGIYTPLGTQNFAMAAAIYPLDGGKVYCLKRKS
jgi:hypothetical protein